MGGHAVERRLDAFQRAGPGLGGTAAQHDDILRLGIAGGHIALAQARVDELAQLIHHRGGLVGFGILTGGHRHDCQEHRQAVAGLHATLHAIGFFERLEIADAGPGVLGVGQSSHQLGDLAFHIAVSLAHLAVS